MAGGPRRSSAPVVAAGRRRYLHAAPVVAAGRWRCLRAPAHARAAASRRSTVCAVGTGAILPRLARARIGPAPAGTAIALRSAAGGVRTRAARERRRGARVGLVQGDGMARAGAVRKRGPGVWCGHAGAGPIRARHHGGTAARCRRQGRSSVPRLPRERGPEHACPRRAPRTSLGRCRLSIRYTACPRPRPQVPPSPCVSPLQGRAVNQSAARLQRPLTSTSCGRNCAL
jgi:hypothetical protein